jgi:hypothetical protein
MTRLRQLSPMLILSLCMYIPSWLYAQSKDSEYQTGTIMKVESHEGGASDNDKPYDVTIRVGNRDYVVRFTSPRGSDRVKYSQGQALLVKVGEKTLGFRDMLGHYSEWPIVGSKEVPPSLSKTTRALR